MGKTSGFRVISKAKALPTERTGVQGVIEERVSKSSRVTNFYTHLCEQKGMQRFLSKNFTPSVNVPLKADLKVRNLSSSGIICELRDEYYFLTLG